MLSIKKKSEKQMKPNSRSYMNSYEWNYMVLDIVDYIEINLSSKKDSDDRWKLFQEYCAKNNLNWRVIKKMVEFTVAETFKSEEELIKCEDFKPLELRKDFIGEEEKVSALTEEDSPDIIKKTVKKKSAEKLFDFTEEDLACLNNTTTNQKKYTEEKTIDIIF